MGSLNAYLDASFLIALFANDSFTPNARQFLKSEKPLLLVSDFACAEFASAVAKRLRVGQFGMSDAQLALSNFDAWMPRGAQQVSMTSADIKVAEAYLRRLDLTLRTPDALHIAMVQRTGATLLTFDKKMAECARVLGIPVQPQ
jgi:predicted nucleic acid-binding protein